MKPRYKILLLTVILFCSVQIKAQDYYWVAFSDKKNTPYQLDDPQAFLSQKAIDRRAKQNIAIDSLDLPVNSNYINQVLTLDARLVHQSKWMNGITIATEDSTFADKAKQLDFVTYVQLTKPRAITKSTNNKFAKELSTYEPVPIDSSQYGPSVYQVGQLNTQYLHNQNIKGQGMQIAVIDAGFYKANKSSSLDSLWKNNQILGTKDFVLPNSNIFATHQHGTSVLSCMGGYVKGILIGTAPKADYWLIRSEDDPTEYLIEEDNWVAAAEYADSIGVDIINTSLGYNHFDDISTNHTYAQMDGETTRISQAADIAFEKGILVFSSAGNEGNKPWKYLTAPSDGDNVICVGAVDQYGNKASFSSFGPSADNETKPNLSALGYRTVVQSSSGSLAYRDGTSFASPVLCGAAACLWQANPTATAVQMKKALEKSSSQYQNPDEKLGYGIPDMGKADKILKSLLSSKEMRKSQWQIYPNPFYDVIKIKNARKLDAATIQTAIFTIDGKAIEIKRKNQINKIELTMSQNLPTGIYFLQISDKQTTEVVKLSKIAY